MPCMCVCVCVDEGGGRAEIWLRFRDYRDISPTTMSTMGLVRDSSHSVFPNRSEERFDFDFERFVGQ